MSCEPCRIAIVWMCAVSVMAASFAMVGCERRIVEVETPGVKVDVNRSIDGGSVNIRAKEGSATVD